MKFSLRHALTLIILSGIPSAITGATGGEPTPLELIRATIASFGGGVLSLWIYHGVKPKVLAPAWVALPGALALMSMSALTGYFLEGKSENICKHCGAPRTTYHFWVCQVSFTKSSRVEELFHYHCVKHDFSRLSEASPLFTGTSGNDVPPFFAQKEELMAKLALLRPVEKMHVLFEQIHPLDRQAKDVRELAFSQLAADVYLPESHNQTEAEAVEAWWTRFAPLMQPLTSPDDLARMKRDCAGEPWIVKLLPK